jgi:hypothetical protein
MESLHISTIGIGIAAILGRFEDDGLNAPDGVEAGEDEAEAGAQHDHVEHLQLGLFHLADFR